MFLQEITKTGIKLSLSAGTSFRAKEPDELWQIDFKGPFSVGGKKYWFLVCIDDYSRFIVSAEQFDHEFTTAETWLF